MGDNSCELGDRIPRLLDFLEKNQVVVEVKVEVIHHE